MHYLHTGPGVESSGGVCILDFVSCIGFIVIPTLKFNAGIQIVNGMPFQETFGKIYDRQGFAPTS